MSATLVHGGMRRLIRPFVDPYLLITVAVSVANNLIWILRYRVGQPLDIDEAGYIGISLVDFNGWLHGGIVGLVNAVELPYTAAPLMTALSSLLYVIFGASELTALSTAVLFGAITTFATYQIALKLADQSTARLAAIIVTSCPLVVNYSRDYNFAIACTALLLLSVMFLLLSDRFTKYGYAVACGVAIGLLPLARTMTLAFLPGFFLAALQQLASQRLSQRSVVGILIAITVAFVTCESWLYLHFDAVFSYLTSFGYGTRSAEYGSSQNIFRAASWEATIQQIELVYAPHFLLLVAGFAASLMLCYKGVSRRGVKKFFFNTLRSKKAALVLLSSEGLLILTSSGNKGSGFILPLIPPLFVLAVMSLLSVVPRKDLVGGAVATIAIVCYVPLTTLDSPIADATIVSLPLFGQLVGTSGQGEIQGYEKAGGYSDSPNMPVDYSNGSSWALTTANVADLLHDDNPNGSPIAFGFRHYILNVNTVGLAQLRKYGTQSVFRMVAPVLTGDTSSGYASWLSNGDAAQSCLLLTASGSIAEMSPKVSPSLMEMAAQGNHFVLLKRITLTDGRVLTVWRRQADCT